jgi:DNA repair protein RadA/Sms
VRSTPTLLDAAAIAPPVPTGLEGLDRVLGGGLVPGSVTLLAGEPGIGKSTLLLQLAMGLSASGLLCLYASGEESRDQIAARAGRLGEPADGLRFVPGRDLTGVVETATEARPFLLAVDSVQTLRDAASQHVPGGPAQVRLSADALVGIAKELDIAVVMTGHVTKDGDVAGPRTLEHAVDTMLSFEGDARSGMRLLAAGKNRFGHEGELAWFEMTAHGLVEIDAEALLRSPGQEVGAATALAAAGRRSVAAEIQALVVPGDGPPRRQTTGLDPRRFQLVAAVVDRAASVPLARAEVYGATVGGLRLDDPACDLAIAAALASAATGVRPPPDTAFVGEVGLTGAVRPASGLERRLAAASRSGIRHVVAAPDARSTRASGIRILAVQHVAEALGWAIAR